MQANGQYQQSNHLQFRHPHLNYNANGINQGYENNTSCNGRGALNNRFAMCNARMSAQQPSNCLPLHNPHPSSRQQYHPNFPVNLNNQMMHSQKTPVSGNPHAFLQRPLNQSSIPYMENVSAPRTTNPTTSSTMQHACYNPQPAVQRPMYSQAFHHAARADPPPYPQHISANHSNVHNAQNIQMPSVTPATTVSTSSVNKFAANNPRVQNLYFVSQANDNSTLHSVRGAGNHLHQMVTNTVNSQRGSLTVPSSKQQTPLEHLQKFNIGGNVTLQIVNPNASSGLLPSQTCMHKQINTVANVKHMSSASEPITIGTKDHVHQVGNAMFYQKMNDVSNNSRLCAPQNHVPESTSGETFAMIYTGSSAPAKDLHQASAGHATRAVAVVLPLSQDGSPNKQSSVSRLQPSNTVSDSCFFKFKLDKTSPRAQDTAELNKPSKQSTRTSNCTDKQSSISSLEPSNTVSDSCFSKFNLDKASAQSQDTADELNKPSKQSTSNSCKSPTDVQANSPPGSEQSSVSDAAVKLSTLPLTFAQLVKGQVPVNGSTEEKSKSGNTKSSNQTKCEEELSSLPTTEWTLGMLHKLIFLEHEKAKKTDLQDGHNSIAKIISQYWNGDVSAMIDRANIGSLYKELLVIRDFYTKLDLDTVILSKNQKNNLSKFHVLSDGEVYQEEGSCTSSWLNINPLDDIDKEFGLPFFVRFSHGYSVDSELKRKLEDNSQTIPKPEELLNKEASPNRICSSPLVTSCSNSIHSKKEQKDDLSHLGQERDEKIVETESMSDAQSPDSSYSFKIEVLPPEEAKIIFHQMECESLQAVAAPETEENPPNEENKKDEEPYIMTPIENYCCIEKWKVHILGLSSEGMCKCAEQSREEEKVVKLKMGNDLPMEIVDLTEDGSIPLLLPEEANITEEDQKLIDSVMNDSSESDNESYSSENINDEHEQGFGIPTESQKVVSTNVLEGPNPVSSQPVIASVSGNIEENAKRITSDSSDPVQHPLQWNKDSSNLKPQTILESFSKSKIGGPAETVELALFGSKHNKTTFRSNQQSHVQSSHCHTPFLSEKMAPKRIYVKLNPLTKSNKQEAEPARRDSVKKWKHENWRKCNRREAEPVGRDSVKKWKHDNWWKSNKREAEPAGRESVKKWIHENWRKSLPLTIIRPKRKNKKFAIVANHGTRIQLHSLKHKDKQLDSKRKRQDSDGLGPKKKRLHVDEKAMKTPKEPVAVKAGLAQENVLKFNVLPNTFNLESNIKPDPKPDERTLLVPTEGSPVIIPAERNSSGSNSKDAWCDDSSSKSSPPGTALVPESSGLFQEFQRLFKIRQASTED